MRELLSMIVRENKFMYECVFLIFLIFRTTRNDVLDNNNTYVQCSNNTGERKVACG